MIKIFKTKINKLISLLTATSLLISFVVGPTAASAINNEQTTKEYNQIFKEFILPYSYGKISNSHFAGTDRVIVNIQDLHCHPKVQKNIANIIETLDKKFGVNKIYLEGAYGEVNTKWISDKTNNNKNVIDQMLNTGRLTGAEYYSALSGKTELIKGLEEKEPYLDNIKRLGKILQDQGNISLILKSLHDCTDKVKKKYYTKRQYKLEQLFNEYKAGRIPSQKYYTLLSKHIDKLGIDLTKYENSLIYVTLLELQKDLNYKQITRELQELILTLKQQIPYNAYKTLLENTESFKEVEKLYSYIVQLDKIYNLNVSLNYKELDKYFRYVELSKRINPVELVKEDEYLVQEINTRFAPTKAQQEVVFLIYFEKYLRDYLTTKITLDDYGYYRDNIEKYKQIYNKYVDNRVLSLLDEYIAETDKFYKINLDRNTYFTKNIFEENTSLNKIENTSLSQNDTNKIIDNMSQVKKLDIVITGGFHSQTVTELLKKQNISYIVITPNVTDGIKLAEDTYYELAKEQSKITFQTIAPVIASLSSKMQELLLEKIGNIQQEEIEKIISLDDTERTKVISELMAANLLESDDLGSVETALQDVIKAIVDDLYKEKITPELISQIKNLQRLLKDKEKLQKVIDLLGESPAKQSFILVSNIFENISEVLDAFIPFARKISQQEQEISIKDLDGDESFDNDIEKGEMDYTEEEIYDDDLDLWFSDIDIINMCREIIKVGKNNKNIKDFIRYLGKHNMADYELLNKILVELKALNNDNKKIQEYCGIIYALINKDNISSKENAVKTKENIMSFFEKPKYLKLKFCDLFSKLFVGHDYMRGSFFNALLDFVNKNEYTDKDFDFLFTVCKYSFLISDLETKENIYNFLALSIEKRRLLYAFYQAPKMYTDIDINQLTLNFILSVLNKYDFSDEQFDYIMRLICSANIKNTTLEKKYIEDLKEKDVNMFILENFKYIDTYNRYLLDLLFSDVDEQNTENLVSKIQTVVNLFDDLRHYKIDTLETENKGFALSVFLNYDFEKYCKDNNINDLVKQYQLAIRVSRKIYSMLGDDIFTTSINKLDTIIKKTLEYYNKVDKILDSLTLFTNKTAIFSLHNNERNSDKKSFRFTPDGIKEILKRLEIEPEVFEAIEISFMDKVLDFIKTIEQDEIDKQVLVDFVNNLDGSVIIKKDILEYLAKKKNGTISKKAINRYVNRLKITERLVEVNRYLKHIEYFNEYGQEKGVFIFDGHGAPDGKSISYSQTGSVTVSQIAQALMNAHKNGVNLENLTLVFSSCHSYKFADNIINELINNGITSFPQIITDAGKETVYAYTTTVDLEGERTKVSNLFYSLMKYLDSKTSDQVKQMKGRLTFKDLADAPRYLSNNTVFVTNRQIIEENGKLETDILDIINEQDIENIEADTAKNAFAYDGTYKLYAEMMLPITKQILDFIGNTGIIKRIYKSNAGENFKNTKFGVVIGVLLESFSFWLPNFVSKHKFDPSQESGVRAVVWKIRALSIGIGIIPAILSLLNPISSAFILPVILLTENISHYIYNIRNSKISVRFNEEEKPIVVLIEKDDDRYSLIFKPKDKSIYLSSNNKKSYSRETTAYDTPESIEQLLGIKIKISKHRLSVKSNDIRTNIKAVKYSEVFEKAKSLVLQDLPLLEEKEIDLVKNNAKCSGVEYIYLDNRDFDNRDKIQKAIKNNNLLILYPFSKTCDIDKLTDEELFSLYLQISTNFINMLREVLPSYPKLKEKDFYGMEYLLTELIKNAFVHGNLADPSKPIYIHCGQNGFAVYNAYDKNKSTSAKRLSFAAMSALSGESEGNKIINGYEKENLITVTRKIGRIDDNFDDEFYVVTIEKAKPKEEQIKQTQVKKDVNLYLSFNGFKIPKDSFDLALKYIRENNNDYEITEKTYEYVQYLLYFLHTKNDWLESYHHDIVRQIFGLGDEYVEILVDYFKKNEGWLKGNIDIIRRIMDFAVKQDCTKEELKELLAFVADIKDVYSADDMVYMRYGYLRKNIRENPISAQFFQYYLQNKSFFESSERYKFLIAHLIFSGDQNIEQCLTNENFDSRLKTLFDNLSERNIRFLNVSEYGLAIKIFFNSVFNKELELQYEKNNQTLTPLLRYRIALKIANSLCEQLGNKARLINQDIINRIVSVCIQDINDKRELLKNRYFIEKSSDFHGNDDVHVDFTEGENADFIVDRGHVSNMGVFSVNNNQTDVKENRIFSSDGILFLFKSLYTKPRVYMDLNVEGDNDVEEKINKQLKAITEYNLIKEKYGLSGSIFAFNGHGADKTICFIGKDGSAKALLTVSDLAKALLQSYKNGANLEEVTLDLSSCFSYNFAKNLIKELKELEEQEGLQIKYPQILSSAGQETELSASFLYKNNNTGQFAMYIDNMASAILEHLQQINRNGESPDSLSFDFIFNSEIDTSNHTIFISGQDVANANTNFRQKLFGILGESFIEKHEVEKTIQTAQLQLPFTQKVLNKIGNLGIIKRIYKSNAGENFKFTITGMILGSVIELIPFFMPNFINAHHFDPSVKRRMVAVVWVVRALTIGIGIATWSVPVAVLSNIVLHSVWNRFVTLLGKRHLMLMLDDSSVESYLQDKGLDTKKIDNLREQIEFLLNILRGELDVYVNYRAFQFFSLKKETRKYIFDLLQNSNVDRFFFGQFIYAIEIAEENEFSGNEIVELIKFLRNHQDLAFFVGDEEGRSFFYKVVTTLKNRNFNITEEVFLQIMFLLPFRNKISIESFFNLKEGSRQKIYDIFKDNKNFNLFANNIVWLVEKLETDNFSDEMIEKILQITANVTNTIVLRNKQKIELLVKMADWLIHENYDIGDSKYIQFIVSCLSDFDDPSVDIETLLKKDSRELNNLFNKFFGSFEVEFGDEEEIITIMVKKDDKQYSISFDVKSGDVTLFSIDNDIVYYLERYKRFGPRELFSFIGIGIHPSKNKLNVVTSDKVTDVKFVKHTNDGKVVPSSQNQIVLELEKEQALVAETHSKGIERIFLDKLSENADKISDAIEENRLLVIYPLSQHYDIDSLTDEELVVLFRTINQNIFQLAQKFPKIDFYTRITNENKFDFVVREFVKNAFVHGNLSDPSKPIYIKFDGDKITVYNAVTDDADITVSKENKKRRLILSTIAELSGVHKGISNIRGFERDGLITVEQDSELRIGTQKYFAISAEKSKNNSSELMLPSTQEMLDKFGENFKYTKLGVALGCIIELFSFWGHNFIKNHNFDPSIQTKMTAVVWVVRALSIGLGLGTGIVVALVSCNPLFTFFGIPALFLTETIAHFIWNFLVVKIEKKALSLQKSKKNKHSVNGIFIKLLSIFLTVFMLMLGGYGIASSVEDTDVINIQQIDIFNDTLDQKSNKDYQKLIDELGVNGINQLLNRVKNENKREEIREQFARYITDSQYVELLLQSIKDENYKEFFETFDPTYNKLIKGNLGNMRAGAKEYETIMDNLGIEGVSKIILSIDDGEIKTAVVNDIIKNKYDYFLADALSKDKLDLFFDTLDSDYSHLLSMNSTETNCLLLNYFSGFNDLEVLLDYFEKNNKSEIKNTLIDKYNTEIMNMYYVDLFCKAIKEGKKEEFLSLFKDKEAVVRTDIKENKKEFLNDLLAAVKGGEVKAFLELFSEENLNNLSLEDYDRVINRISVENANNLLNSIENNQLREKIRQNFQNNITDERYIALLIEANANNNFSTLFEIYDPNFEHLQSFSKEQNQGLISELETPGINKLLNGINNVDVKENMRQIFEKNITSEQYENLLISSIKSNDFKSFFNIFDPDANNLKNVQFKYQSLLLNNKTEVNKFLSYVKTINSSSYYFLNNNFDKAQRILTYIDQNSNNEALKEYKDNYIYLDLSLDELKQYKEFYDYVKKKNFVNKEISFDDIISQITSEGNGKLVFQVLADYDFNKLYDNYDEKYQAAIAITEYINSYCEAYGIEDTTVIKDTDMKQIIQYVSSAYNKYMEENTAKTIIDSKTQVVSIVGDNERKGEFVVRDFVSVLDYIKQDRNKRSFFTFDTDVDSEQMKTDFLNKLIKLSEQNPNQHIFINIHAHGYPGGFVVSDSVRITTEELTDTLIKMHNNGVNLSNVTIGFNSCNTYFSSTEIYNRLEEANIERLPVIYAEAGFETKLGFSKGSVYGEETYLYTTLLNNLKSNNGKKVVVSDFYDVQADITWANPTLFVQIDNDSFDKLDKQLSAVISKYSINTVDVSDTDKNIDDLENREDLSPEDIEFLEGDSNYSNTAFPINIFAYSIFSKEQNAEFNEKASIWEEIVFRAVPAIISSIYDKDKSNKLKYFNSMQHLFIYAHAILRWLTNENNVRNKISFDMLLKQIKQEMSKGTDILVSIYKDALSTWETSNQEKIKTAVIQATLKAIGLHEAYNKGFISREEFESGKYDDNIIRQMLINMGITYEFVENLINQSLFLLGYSNENVKQKVFDMSVVYNALLKYKIIGEQVRKTSYNEQPALKQNNEAIINYDKNDYVTVLLIKKSDGTQYSVRLALNRIKEGETDYIRTGILDRKMFVYLSSINDDAFSTATSKYTTLEYIERITGVKIEVTDNTIIAKSLDSDTQVSLLRSRDVRQQVASLMPKQIPAIDQQQQVDVEEIVQTKVTETIYLDEPSEEIERKFKRAIENNSLIVIYPFSHTYDMDSLTDDQIYSLYFDIQDKFFELQEILDNYLPEIDTRRGMAYILKEFIKNAFVHGNISDPSQPIYIKFIRNGFTVINSEGKVKYESTKLNRVNLSAAATLTGAHRGLQIIRDYEEQGLIKLEQEIEPGKAKGSNYYIVTAERVYEQDQDRTKIDFNSLIERVFAIIDLIEKTNNKYPKDRAKSMTEAEQILTDTFTPEELEVIDLLASTIFDSIKYVNSTRNTSAVEFVNIIYSLQNGLFNDNLLMAEGDLRQHVLDILKHYIEVSKQKKSEENILVKAVKDNENILDDMANFLTDLIVKKNLIEKAKQQREQRRKNISRFIEGVRKDDTAYSAVMICSANENRSAIWHIMFENFLKRTKRKMTRVLSAGVFYDISQEIISQTGQARVLRDDYHETLTFDERYKGIDEDIKSGFRSRYIKYLKLPKGSQPVFIVAGEQHRAQLIKLGYDLNWIFLMSEFYSDEFKTEFKQTHESLGKELEENNIFSMSEFPDPFEEQILRQDLPELVRSLVDYVFKTRDDIIRETLPTKFAKFTDDYNQFEHMDELPSFAFTDTEKREAAREFYEDDISALDREKNQFEFRANTKYLYVLQNRNNKDALLAVVSREDAELKFKLLALMYLARIRRGLTQEETNVMTVARDKIITEFKKQLENNSFKVLNNFDLRSYMMGIYLLLQDDSLNKPVPGIIYNAFIINTDGLVLANSNGYFATVDLFTIVHELTHVVVSKPGFYSKLVADTVDELVSYVTPNMFLSMANLSLQAYSKTQTGYTMHQTKGVIDYVKMGKKLHVLYNLFSGKTIDRELRQEEHSAPIAFLELLFNAHAKVGKMVDWVALLEAIKTIDDENLDQSSMFADVLDTYIKMLVVKDKLTKQEADNLINEIEKMQMWTLLTYDIVQNIKVSDSGTYAKIIGNKSAISFEEQILTKPAETKEQLNKIANAIKSKEQLSRNDILTLLIIDVISSIDYEQLINNFDGVIEGIVNSIRIAAQMFDMQKETYSLSEYEQISKYVTENYSITQNSKVSVMDNIFEFISNSLDKLFFAKLLINQVFGTKDLSNVMKDKKLLIVTSKQQEETLQQVLQNNGIDDIKIVSMEIITRPTEGIRSDMVLDVQKGIKARYDTKENKLIIYSKQGIDISTQEIQSLIMQEYFSERSEDIVADDVIAFATVFDATFADITNRLKTAYTASVAMPNKETNFDLSSRIMTSLATACKQEFKATGIKTFVITNEQAKQFADEIKSLHKQDFRFIISCKSDNVTDITDYDGLLIDANAIANLDQAMKFMESIKKKVLTQGVAKQISIKFGDEIYSRFEYLSIDVFNKYGIIPVFNAEKIWNIGRCTVENITENNIELLLRSNNVIGLVIDNARVFVGKKSLIKQLFSKEHKYNKGYNASLSSKFDHICYDVPALAELLNIDINNEKELNKLKNIDLSMLNLSSDALTYLEYLQKKGNYEEMTGFIRGIAMNTARTQIINVLKEKSVDLDLDKFAKEANGKYQKAFLTVAVQLMLEGIDVTNLLETEYIDSNMTAKQYLDSIYEKVNVNIEDILKNNEYRIQRIEDTAKSIEDFKNYVVLLDNLRIIKETTANFDMSIKAVRNMLAAA